uniref:Uncharacterized protein n=1 Tax=Arundo donax TaxID=35708 RepID=A0A0A9GB88_ARUDO
MFSLVGKDFSSYLKIDNVKLLHFLLLPH